MTIVDEAVVCDEKLPDSVSLILTRVKHVGLLSINNRMHHVRFTLNHNITTS